MFIAASPGKDRSAVEKEEMAKKYKPGDQVLPTINTRRTAEERRAYAEDRRLIDEVTELSLQEAGVSSAPPRTRRRRESRSADDRRRSSRDRERDRERDRSLDSRHQRGSRRPRMEDGGRHSSDQLPAEGERRRRRSESRQRQIEHQSSIRSLISSGDMSERDIEREIESFARQIQEEGLLDGLDLDNIDLSRDDELSRRITEAYRRRQRDRTRQEARRNNYPPLTRPAENSAADARLRVLQVPPALQAKPRNEVVRKQMQHQRASKCRNQYGDQEEGPLVEVVARQPRYFRPQLQLRTGLLLGHRQTWVQDLKPRIPPNPDLASVRDAVLVPLSTPRRFQIPQKLRRARTLGASHLPVVKETRRAHRFFHCSLIMILQPAAQIGLVPSTLQLFIRQ
ncbi:hypothetical protein FPSE5266_20306 [Fusarium pseudograminearum]|nr:hypothetical protein FPSE5266_20306 [Fusarium pseudograminearum]